MINITFNKILKCVLSMYYLLSAIHGHLDAIVQLSLPKKVIKQIFSRG